VEPKVHVVIVSDHGMATVQRVIQIGTDSELLGLHIANESSHVMLYSEDRSALERAYAALPRKPEEYSVYRRDEVPAHLCFSDNQRIGDIVILANGPYILHARDAGVAEEEGQAGEWPKGWHGYDPSSMAEMHAIFYAYGPRIRPGVRLEAVRNTDVYSLLAALLGIGSVSESLGDILK
jgi:predicted AlkP superfamily pyrophosphatase or phosphodiesterase